MKTGGAGACGVSVPRKRTSVAVAGAAFVGNVMARLLVAVCVPSHTRAGAEISLSLAHLARQPRGKRRPAANSRAFEPTPHPARALRRARRGARTPYRALVACRHQHQNQPASQPAAGQPGRRRTQTRASRGPRLPPCRRPLASSITNRAQSRPGPRSSCGRGWRKLPPPLRAPMALSGAASEGARLVQCAGPLDSLRPVAAAPLCATLLLQWAARPPLPSHSHGRAPPIYWNWVSRSRPAIQRAHILGHFSRSRRARRAPTFGSSLLGRPEASGAVYGPPPSPTGPAKVAGASVHR